MLCLIYGDALSRWLGGSPVNFRLQEQHKKNDNAISRLDNFISDKITLFERYHHLLGFWYPDLTETM